MSYIGNQPQYTAFVTDEFSGNGSTTAFTMSVAPVNSAAVLVAISGVLQAPSTYGVAGRILTFSQAPPSGTGNISVRYLGLPASNVTTSAYRSVSEFTATAGQTTFAPASYTPGFINVYRSGVRLGTDNYVATNGATVVLNNAAAAGDLISIESFFASSVLNAIPAVANSISSSYLAGGAASQNFLDISNAGGTGAMLIPSGTSAQRPTSTTSGMVRYNSTTGFPEWYSTALGTWVNFADAPFTVEYIIVAGGGAGGSDRGGGGGAGGYLTGSMTLSAGTAYPVTIGGGGGGGANTFASGNNTTALGLTAIGGGGGANNYGNVQPAGSGGSGGGGSDQSARGAGGSGTSGQGNSGGAGVTGGAGGGGGGAGGTGQSSGNDFGGAGGAGRSDTWTGSTRTIAGGGGGANNASGSAGAGAAGGGNGSVGDGNQTAGSASANTGSGGGGATGGGAAVSGSGGSGIVVIRYLGSQRSSGGFVSSSGGYTLHTFTSSSTFTA